MTPGDGCAVLRFSSVNLSVTMTHGDAAMTNSSEGGVSVADFVEYRIATCLWLYVAPVLLVVGVTGNVLSLAVLLGRSFRKSSLSFTLGALAVVDSAVLCTALSRHWIMILSDNQLDVRTSAGAFGCKLHFFLTYYLSSLARTTPTRRSVACLARSLIYFLHTPFHTCSATCYLFSPTTSLICPRGRLSSSPLNELSTSLDQSPQRSV